MNILLMPNLDKPNAAACTAAVAGKLISAGASVAMSLRYRELLPLPGVSYGEFFPTLAESDAIIAIGGDGTILHAAKHAVDEDKPLLGVNVGRLGFMAGLEVGELDLLERLLTGDYHVEERMMLDCIHHSQGGQQEHLALNDVVLSNGAVSRMIELDVHCAGRPVVSYRADGAILSTPTGSTAYALSAGGPIVEPSINCICLTPICSHSLFNRTVLFAENQTVQIRPSQLNRNPIYLTVDGEEGGQLAPGDVLEVKRSRKHLRLICLKDQSFYETLSQKFALHGAAPVTGGEFCPKG